MTTALGGPNIPPGGWLVTGQTQQTKFLPGQQLPTPGYQINFQTSYGVAGSVWVSVADYNADTVKAAIAEAVAKLDAVSALSHTS